MGSRLWKAAPRDMRHDFPQEFSKCMCIGMQRQGIGKYGSGNAILRMKSENVQAAGLLFSADRRDAISALAEGQGQIRAIPGRAESPIHGGCQATVVRPIQADLREIMDRAFSPDYTTARDSWPSRPGWNELGPLALIPAQVGPC
jgi:hypothetical protein